MGISFSTNTRRRTPTHPYPPPHHHMDYYPPYPMHPAPYSVHSPSSPPAYYPYYNSNAYTVCNHANPLVGHSYFGPVELQAPLPLEVAPSGGEQKTAKVVTSDVNVHKDTLRLETDELNRDHYLITFIFDALLDGSITVCYFAREEADRRVAPLFPESYVPIKVPFRKGLHQEFRQPSGTGIDLRYFALDVLSSPSSRNDVYPIIISADTCSNPYMMDNRSYVLPDMLVQMQTTQVVLAKSNDGQFTPKVIRQLLWTHDSCYELREIYGLGKSSPGLNDNGSGKDCVVCMTEPKDITLLPCRHMCMCSSCANALRLQTNKCPICRENIEALLEIKLENLDG
ncbi:hypothetical protein ACS0TY_014169 [Phlomoides rotata]